MYGRREAPFKRGRAPRIGVFCRRVLCATGSEDVSRIGSSGATPRGRAGSGDVSCGSADRL